MTIEATLQSIDSKLGALLAAVAAGATMAPAENIAAGEQAVAEAGLNQAQSEPLAGKPRRGRPPKAETAPAATQTPPAATPAPTVSSAADFLSLEAPAAEKPVTLQEVRAALAVVQARAGQAAALELFKTASGQETLAKLQPDKYAAVFKAALPAGKLALEDVRVVLVAANERKANSGLEVMKANGANTIQEVTPDKFVKVILDGHQVQ